MYTMTQIKKSKQEINYWFYAHLHNFCGIFSKTHNYYISFYYLYLTTWTNTCGSLHKNGSIDSGTFTTTPCWCRCGIVEQNVSLGGFWDLRCSSQANGSGSLPAACKSWCRISAPSSTPCLFACCHPSYRDDNGINLWSCERAPIKCFPMWVAVVMVSLYSNRNPR